MKLEGKQRQGIGTTRRGTPANAILGWTFKENVPDIRNTRVIDIHRELKAYGVNPVAFDPHADNAEIEHEYGFRLIENVAEHVPYDAVITAVKHGELLAEFTLEKIRSLGGGRPPVLIDVKGFFAKPAMEAVGFSCWQL